MTKVLIGSIIREQPEILEFFLDSLRFLYLDDINVDYLFVDDNIEQKSSSLLSNFRPPESIINIVKTNEKQGEYVKDRITHHWNEQLTWRVAHYKNMIINYCKEHNYNYLFLLDSDLVLHPETLINLISIKKDIISEIFWTKWEPDSIEMPQVWLYDSYILYKIEHRDENLTEKEKRQRSNNFLNMLKKPGVYKVGGLGACTLYSRYALKSGVSFEEIYNISFWGEDRHLAIRAAALGFELFVDTHYPAYHIYRESDLEGVTNYVETFREMSLKGCRSQIFEVIKNILLELESMDFRQELEVDNFKKKFTEQGWLSFDYQSKRDYIFKNRIIYQVSIVEIKEIFFSDQFKKCDLRLELKLEGSKKGESIEKLCELDLKFVYRYGWKINYYNTIKEGKGGKISRKMFFDRGDYNRVIKLGIPGLTLAMLVHNEADRYLSKTLKHVSKYVDNAVILDDASTDGTVALCRDILNDIPLKIISNDKAGFDNEINLRQQLWELVLETDPDWILCLDADEIFEERAITRLKELIKSTEIDVYAFRLYDFWDREHYREDQYWNAHLRFSPFLVRYQPEFSYRWNEKPIHCGRFPANVTKLPVAKSNLRIKHLGWVKEKDRKKKYERYTFLDPDGEYGNIDQYESILNPDPNLKKWIE